MQRCSEVRLWPVGEIGSSGHEAGGLTTVGTVVVRVGDVLGTGGQRGLARVEHGNTRVLSPASVIVGRRG